MPSEHADQTAGFFPLTERIVVTGSECTGKTTLSRQLAEHLDARWLPEYAREYATAIGRPLDATDVEPIACGQLAREDAMLALSPHRLLADTDLVSTVVYARHYYGACPAWIERAAAERVAPLYLLCDVDLPWEPDGVRDQPGARLQLQQLFRAQLQIVGATVAAVRGLGAERLANALAAVGAWRQGASAG